MGVEKKRERNIQRKRQRERKRQKRVELGSVTQPTPMEEEAGI